MRAILFLSLTIVLLLLLHIGTGPLILSFSEVVAALWRGGSNPIHEQVIWDLRLPKALAALVVGGSLGLSGLLLQTFFQNPLAGPYVLGLSGSASLGAALWLLGGAAWFWASSPWGLALAAGAGALVGLLLLMSLGGRLMDQQKLLLVGMFLGSISGALVSVLQVWSPADRLQQFIFWSMGSLGGVTWVELSVLLPLHGLLWWRALRLVQPLNALLLGEWTARSLGVELRRLRWEILIITALLTGSITAFCGPIAFIGTAVPHLARWTWRTGLHDRLLWGVLLWGMAILLGCQWLCQLPYTEKALPVSVVTALVGGPIVIAVLVKGRR